MLIKYLKPDFEFADHRGNIVQLVHDGWKQFNYISSVAGSRRGLHYHKFNNEAFFVIKGNFKLILQRYGDENSEEYKLKTGSFFMIEPFVKHSFDFLENTELVSMYSKGVELGNGSKDIWE